MLPIKLVSSLLLLLFLVNGSLSTAQHVHRKGSGLSVVSHGKVLKKVLGPAAGGGDGTSGRKMLFEKVEWTEKAANGAGQEGPSNAGLRSLLSEGIADHIHEGFVAFNADYHGPKHHPPKNN